MNKGKTISVRAVSAALASVLPVAIQAEQVEDTDTWSLAETMWPNGNINVIEYFAVAYGSLYETTVGGDGPFCYSYLSSAHHSGSFDISVGAVVTIGYTFNYSGDVVQGEPYAEHSQFMGTYKYWADFPSSGTYDRGGEQHSFSGSVRTTVWNFWY